MAMRKVGETAKAGFYFNTRTWEVTLHRTTGDALPGKAGDRCARIPALALLLLGPVMGLAFVIFLPLIGFALVGLEIGRWLMKLVPTHAELKPKAAKR